MPVIAGFSMSSLHSRQERVGGLDPPPGVVPNFDHPEDYLWTINIVTQGLCIPISTILVACRLYARVTFNGRLSLDDYACLLGWVFALAYSIIALLMSRHGAGINQWEVPEEDVQPYLRLVYATMVNYGPCAFFIKTSIILFCAKVFAPFHIAVRVMRGAIILMALYYFPILFIKAFICRPLSLFWDPMGATGTCFNQRALILADSVISVASDLAILLLPIPLACGLQVTLSRKIKVAGIFSAGGVATICSIIRMIDIIKNGEDPNATYTFMRINLWGIAEVNIGLICACLPVMPALCKHLWPSVFHSTIQRSYSSRAPSIHMSSERSRKATRHNVNPLGNCVNKPVMTTDEDTDENVLIGPLDPRKDDVIARLETSVEALKCSKGRDKDDLRSISPEDQSVIMKTVEVRQTLENDSETTTWFRIDD